MKNETTKAKHVVRAIEICTFLAQHQNKGCITTAALSSHFGFTVSCVEKIIKPLKENQILSAIKGPGGGYVVAGDLSLISMWDIASVFEPMISEAEDEGGGRSGGLASYELGLEQVIQDTLSSVTLLDFVDVASDAVKSHARVTSRFKFKPLAAPFVPKAPNSVFQLARAG